MEATDIEHGDLNVSDLSDLTHCTEPAPGNLNEFNSAIQNLKHTKGKNGKPAASSPPCNCVVLKNLDFNMSKDTLAEVLGRLLEGHGRFTNISLAGDKASGTFRGVAFVTFSSVKDASVALKVLNKVVINQRKVVAEYRRVRGNERKDTTVHDKRLKKGDYFASQPRRTAPSSSKHGEVPLGEEMTTDDINGSGRALDKRAQFFANRETGRRAEEYRRQDDQLPGSERDKMREVEFRKILIRFANGALRTEENESLQNLSSAVGNADEANIRDLVFDSTLTSFERRMVHLICDELQLGHISKTDEAGNRSLHVTRNSERAAEWAREELSSSQVSSPSNGRSRETRTRRNTRVGPASEFSAEDHMSRRNYFRPRAASAADGSADSSSGLLPPSYRVYTPKHQPSGPDGTLGFHARRKHHNVDAVVPADNTAKLSNNQDNHSFDKFPAAGGLKASAGVKQSGSKGNNSKKHRKQSVLNPSVPAFSPMNETP